MINYAIDWSIKKDLVVTKDGKKVKRIPATLESFDKFIDTLVGKEVRFYFEEGGGDSFKLAANKRDVAVFTTIGKDTSNKREELGLEKTDENDVKIIWQLAKEEPEKFREFNELDIKTAKICVLFKIRKDAEENLVRAKNKLWALSKRLELLEMGEGKEKLLKIQKKKIKVLVEEFNQYTSELNKLVVEHPIWNGYLKDTKGVGPACAGGLISGIKRASKFGSKYSLRHYAGMITKKGNQGFNHSLKRALYFFAEGIIKARTPIWRELYDNIKTYYANKHPDWIRGKVHNYAIKFTQTKFLDTLYKKMVEVENATINV